MIINVIPPPPPPYKITTVSFLNSLIYFSFFRNQHSLINCREKEYTKFTLFKAMESHKFGMLLPFFLILFVGATAISDPGFSQPARATYHVFVNFRGKDIGPNFLSHVIHEFSRKQIFAFVDYQLERGNELSPALVAAIERSLIALVIFSVNYASSFWCLEELVKILECKERQKLVLIPVFFNVDPSDVRHQRGTYGNALIQHENTYGLAKADTYRSALKDTANLSGFASTNFKNDAELLDEITNCILMKLKAMHPINFKGLTGIEKPFEHINSLLHQGSNDDVRAIGIWGMGGIGKTTVAEEAFYRLRYEFHGSCFLENVREDSERNGIISLKEKLFSTLLEEDLKFDTSNGLPAYIRMRLAYMKVLVVLDDVNDSHQLEILFGDHNWFGPGSRIIVTSRDKQVLINDVDLIYQVGELDFDDAFTLFNLNAFKQNHLDVEYHELSKRVVNYANGIPLVLKVLGELLHGKDNELWESELYKLKKFPNKKIHNVMKLSYDDLDNQEQRIFLDLACFFSGLILKVSYVKILLKNSENDNSVAIGLEMLKDKSLISVSKDNIVYMHNIIQQMGQEIVRQESSKKPGDRSRLWDSDDIYEVLKNDKGSEAIRSIRAHLSAITKLKLSPHVFVKMSNVQFMDFHSENDQDGLDILPQGLQYLPTELKYLRWINYPLKSLPGSFSPENLVILDLSYSHLEKLWHGEQNLVNLKQVRLYGSKYLKELPDFSKAINLELLDVRFCSQLTNLTVSISSLDNLEKLI
ncbi:disease resistance protein RPP5 [Cajanus cajan]|uniref:disease resistance protein RPP5 n=1 Tax=Cajanus cajan TaxID=3821 RepID=UPI0010FBB160|nr:disease resistance protein RPP5 [Cajanus cajan]